MSIKHCHPIRMLYHNAKCQETSKRSIAMLGLRCKVLRIISADGLEVSVIATFVH